MRFTTFVSTAALSAALVVSTAAAHAVTCATFITSDLSLSNDLIDCPDQGLIVSSVTSITIKLNGHTISGLPGSSSGIGIADSTDVVVVGPGVIKGFTAGLAINSSNSVRVENLILANNSNNIYMLDTVDSLILGSTLSDGSNGVLIDGAGVSYANRVMDNEIVNNSTNGIMLRGVSKTEIDGNYIKANGVGLNLSGADNNVAIGNTFLTNTYGVKFDVVTPGAAGADRNLIQSNRFRYNTNGIVAQAFAGGPGRNRYNVIDKNRVYDGDVGINIDGPKNIKTRVRYNNIVRMSADYIIDTGTATAIVGNTCTPGPC
ncbi:MAG: right-handed parallel beta-helix repeat-containing protein [Gammaproteobacteria bacterium]|nr:right-handed parallel beta-helix repeat-containing protein [Gammaproteobacteria bacterium]